MLVFSRFIGEWCVIDNNIGVVIVDILEDKVLLGIRAPVEVVIQLKEEFDAVQQDASSPPDHSESVELQPQLVDGFEPSPRESNRVHQFDPDEEGTLLELSLNLEESIVIGGTIVITVLFFRDKKVRIGIDAPPEVPVHRLEVYRAILREDELARQRRESQQQDGN